MPTNCLSVFDHFVGLALKGYYIRPEKFVIISTERGIRAFSNPYLQWLMKWYNGFIEVFGTLLEALRNEMKGRFDFLRNMGSREEGDILRLRFLWNMPFRIFITVTIALCMNYFAKFREETRCDLMYFFKKDICLSHFFGNILQILSSI